MGGLLAFGVATPVAIGCCGSGTALLATTIRGIGVWLSGFGGLSMRFLAALAFLVVREARRSAKRRASIFNNSSNRKSVI